jgi:hypothetical protein
MLCLFLGIMTLLFKKNHTTAKIDLLYKNKALSLSIHNNKSYLIMHSAHRTRPSNQKKIHSWIQYTLRPALAYHYGHVQLEALCLMQPHHDAYLLAQELCKKHMIKKMYLYTNKTQTHQELYDDLIAVAKRNTITITHIDRIYTTKL